MKIKHHLLPILVLFFITTYSVKAIDTLKISDAVLKKRISLIAEGNGGLGEKSVSLTLRNNVSSSLLILIPAGQILNSADADAQDLIVLEEIIVSLPPKKEGTTILAGACTQMSNYAPKKGESYNLGQIAVGPLLKVAQIVSDNNFSNVNAQAAVWGITDGGSINNIHGGRDVNITWDLVKIVAVHQKESLPDKDEFLSRPIPQARILFSARNDLSYHAPRNMRGTLALYNESGDMIREYFKNKNLNRGVHIYTIGVNDILEEVEIFKAKLVDDKGGVLAEMDLDQSLPYEEVEQKTIQVNFEYIVRKPATVSMIIYDSKGNLVEEIFTNRRLVRSKRTARFKFFHAKKDEEFFTVRLTNDLAEVLHEEKILNN
ncbi:MAG: hypothetical protein JXQ96_03280 [Cyclobacteriaceae bacterium]